MQVESRKFKTNAREALQDENLKQALGKVKDGFIGKRAAAVQLVPEWQQIRSEARTIKNHVLENLDHYLLAYESAVQSHGGQVHWAATADDASQIIVDICRSCDATTVTKGKSMVGEEAGLNEALAEAGIEPIETDLGEYIIQLAKEAPSHIIAPAIHKTREQVSDLFYLHHAHYGLTERLTDRSALVNEARSVLREKFRAADVGITGANFLIAETGQHVLVTNEGNGDLTSNLPRVQIVIVGIEKVVPTLEDASCLLRLLARSATGQHFSNYTSLMCGPRREGEADGPDAFHVVLVDNHRTEMLAGELREMLRCFRCGACLNHCPVYGAIGGHAYGWVYPGPMGSVVTPAMVGNENAPDLPHACTLNGRCAEVCPMSIPLPELLREHRRRSFVQSLQTPGARYGLGIWAALAARPRLYRAVTGLGVALLWRLGRRRGAFRRLPLAGAWTRGRDLPAPQGRKTFMSLHRKSGNTRPDVNFRHTRGSDVDGAD
ncbi:MAG: iron-sulfur cluster-binding protein [Granulosicoccus sp.]|nr:iron-sulfur cluster-binding protein [Granulosicoccus sp.]